MDLNKLKVLTRKANAEFNSSILTKTGTKPSNNITYFDQQTFGQIKCDLCEQVRRQNYQLKQQLYDKEDKVDKVVEIQRQLSALKQLFDLKCQETSLVRKQLQSYKQKLQEIQNKSSQFCQSSINNINRKLRQIETACKNHQ